MKQYEISLDEELRVVRVVAHGELTQPIGEEIITRARVGAAEHGYSILYDVRNASPKVSLAAWYFLPRDLKVLREGKTRNIKAAILIAPGDSENEYQFYEDVTQNVGLNVRIFFDEDEAIGWLTGKG